MSVDMKMEMDLLSAYKEVLFEESTILLAEHIFRKDQSVKSFFILLSSLFAVSKYAAINWIVNRRKEYFEHEEIQRLYIESMKRVGDLSQIGRLQIARNSPIQIRSSLKSKSWVPINPSSLNSYYQAIIQKGSEKKRQKYLEEAISLDEKNLEAYIYIGMNKSLDELPKYVKQIKDQKIQTLFRKILMEVNGTFSLFSRSFYSPFTCFRIAKKLFNERQMSEMFQLVQYIGSLYPSDYITYIIRGMYYILLGRHLNAKRSLFKSLQMNNSFGMGWILLGYCQAFLCEGNNAIACYEKAEVFLMEENYIPSLGIALEYHRMRSYKKAEKKYLEIQNKYGLDFCFNSYISLLIVQERYDEALARLMQKENYTGERAFLKSICYLFMNDAEKAEASLSDVNISYHRKTRSKYYLLLGYIRHINKKYCEAIELYQKAILDPSKPVGSLVNDLLELAIKNSLEEDDKKLITQYKVDIFEFLDLKSDLPLFL